MAKIIVLEGPDGSGKTTLAQEFVKRYGFEYVHLGVPSTSEDLFETYVTVLINARDSKKNVVIDRLHMGEATYGKIYRGQDRLGTQGVKLLTRILNGYGASVVACLPPYEVCLANWKSRHATEYVADEVPFEAIYSEYRKLSDMLDFGVTGKYDYTKMPLDMAVDVLMSSFCDRKALPPGVIGSTSPAFLFIGERANSTLIDLPFMALNASSSYLNGCIEEAGYLEREFAMMNAVRIDGKSWRPSEVWETLGQPIPVFLGQESRRHFNTGENSTAGVLMPHPAYWKRFRSSEKNTYVDMLRKIRLASYNGLGNHGQQLS